MQSYAAKNVCSDTAAYMVNRLQCSLSKSCTVTSQSDAQCAECTWKSGGGVVVEGKLSSCCTAGLSHCLSPTLSQQLDTVKTDFAESPDRGIEHVIPLEPDAPPCSLLTSSLVFARPRLALMQLLCLLIDLLNMSIRPPTTT